MEKIGVIIKRKLKGKGIKVTDFASALHCNRMNVYSIFNRENIDIKLLEKISVILECNLLAEYRTNNSQSKHILLIEVDDLKMKEIQSDSQITVLYNKNV